jgi:hypothetical protein
MGVLKGALSNPLKNQNPMLRLLRVFLAVMVISGPAAAQCGTGYTQAQLNWDALEFLNTSNFYSGYVTTAMAATQNLYFASQKVTVTNGFAGAANQGINSKHTGETGAFGTGADLQFVGNGTITFTFPTAVQNVTFSLFDIDVSQRAAITASNGATAASINLATLTGTGLTITNNNTTTARVDASSAGQAATTNAGTVNVTIAGPITSFTITTSNTGTVTNGPAAGREDGSFWLSDISACTNVTSSYPDSYYSVSQPWTGQPGYVLVVVNNTIYQVSPGTGKAKAIFTDNGATNINSLAYDPYNHYIYYTYSLTGTPATDKAVKKYDYTTGTISTFIADVNTLGIPTYESGVESGSAAFYNGALYLGIEGYGGTSSAVGRRSTVWRIDIDATTGAATSATIAYGVPADDGSSTTNTHDWSDIGINNGILYDFDGAASAEDVYQFNLYTGALTRYTPTATFTPNQVAIDYNGVIYNVNSAIAKYNGTTGLTAGSTFTIAATGLPAGGSYGDGGEAFKPKGDLGDAPATYDPVALSPAVHEVNSNLRLGATITSEYSKSTSALATGDADDGLPTPSIVINNSNYLTSVNVFNNTGASATVCAWVDFNNNGVFDPSEGVSTSVPSSSSTQTVQLFWPNPTTTLTPYSYTFIRIRVTSAVNGMTVNNPTGWFDDGEVEDYRVQVNAYALPSNLVRFDARRHDVRKGMLSWQVADELPGTRYAVQHSHDGHRWTDLQQQVPVSGTIAARHDYSLLDAQPFEGINYYRLQVLRPGGIPVWSSVRELYFNEDESFVLAPNPARGAVALQVRTEGGPALLRIYSAAGAIVYEQSLQLSPGGSTHSIPLPERLPAAAYIVELRTTTGRYTRPLAVQR